MALILAKVARPSNKEVAMGHRGEDGLKRQVAAQVELTKLGD